MIRSSLWYKTSRDWDERYPWWFVMITHLFMHIEYVQDVILGCPRTSIEDVPIICPSMFLSNSSWIYRPRSSKMIYYHPLWYFLLILLKRCRNLGLPDCQIKACNIVSWHVTYIVFIIHDHHNTKIITDNYWFFF